MPAGRTVTVQLYGLTVDYDLQVYNAAGTTRVAQSNNDGVNGEQASWTNSSASAVTVKIRVERYDPTRTTYRLGVGY